MTDKSIRTLDSVRDADVLTDILSSGAIFPLIVTGTSMLPFLRPERDTVLLRRADKPRRGRIVFFRRRSGEFILHRIRRIYPDGRLLINGDAQNWCELIASEQILAEVISVRRDGREIAQEGFIPSLLRALWYPTRTFRPFIWRTYGAFRRLLGGSGAKTQEALFEKQEQNQKEK